MMQDHKNRHLTGKYSFGEIFWLIGFIVNGALEVIPAHYVLAEIHTAHLGNSRCLVLFAHLVYKVNNQFISVNRRYSREQLA